MCKILLSIKPEYVDRIIKGEKKFEFRTKVAKRKVDKIVIYSTSPVMKVMGEVEVKSVLSEEPKILWEKTEKYAGVKEEFFDLYFGERDTAYAYELGNVKVFEQPLDLKDFGCKTAPQSFVYI